MALSRAADCETCGSQRGNILTRRALLLGATATSAGVALAVAPEGSAAEAQGTSPEPLPVLVGTVAAAGAERVLVDPAQADRPEVTLVLQAGARVWRLGSASLSDYALGDDISAYGTVGEDGTVHASIVNCDLYSVQGPVRSPRADSITLGSVPLRVGPRMLSPTSVDGDDEFVSVGRGQVPNLRVGAEARALVLRNSRGPGLIWQLGVR